MSHQMSLIFIITVLRGDELGSVFLLAVALAFSAVAMTACQTTRKAQPEMLTGDAEAAHERHAT